MLHYCQICDKTFSRADSLKRHQISVHHKTIGPNDVNIKTTDISHPAMNKGPNDILLGQEPLSVGLQPPQENTNFRRATDGGQGTLLEGPGTPYNGNTNFTFKHPFTMVIAAPTGFGKTVFVTKVLEYANQTIDPLPQRIIWCYSQWQPLYQAMLSMIPGIEFIRGVPPNMENDSFLDVNSRNLIVLDDLMSDIGKDQRITDLFTKGSHHRNLSVIVLMQNFYEPKTVTIRRNAHYLVLFNMPGDQQQVKTMSQRMFPHKPNYMMEEYKRATSKPYGYLLVDLKPETPEHARLKTNILPADRNKNIPP